MRVRRQRCSTIGEMVLALASMTIAVRTSGLLLAGEWAHYTGKNDSSAAIGPLLLWTRQAQQGDALNFGANFLGRLSKGN
jgi:hypothetical protein